MEGNTNPQSEGNTNSQIEWKTVFHLSKLQNMSISRNNKLFKDDTSFGPWMIQVLWSKTANKQKTQAFWGFTF
jgi:hypothetical protein